MNCHAKSAKEVLKFFSSDAQKGLDLKTVEENRRRYGSNSLSEAKKITLFKRIVKALSEPMMIILLFGLTITFGVNIGKFIKDGSGSFYECVGILIAISLSVALTVVMEGRSERAFEYLKKMGGGEKVRVKRGGKMVDIDGKDLVAGDVVIAEAGEKIAADGRIIACCELKTDESTLTGESRPVSKRADIVLKEDAPLADRKNLVYSGTFVAEGTLEYVVTAVGDDAEIGRVAGAVGEEKSVSAPLKEKLERLGKLVSVFGLVCAAFVFVLSLVRLILLGEVTFDSVEDIFIESIVLIVAAVPEGLPTTVAISLSLNVVRLAKSNALIKKLVATETIGSVSVICSDKTGTLTMNKMLVEKLFTPDGEFKDDVFKDENVCFNCAVNSTARLDGDTPVGSATEGALLLAMQKSGVNFEEIRKGATIISAEPFDSFKKYSSVTVDRSGVKVEYIKGAPEVVVPLCEMTDTARRRVLQKIERGQSEGMRALAFCHRSGGETAVFDGFALITDRIRDGVKEAVDSCKKAGVRVMILTGDGSVTAAAIARGLGLGTGKDNVVTAADIEKLSDEKLKEMLKTITVVARSTPSTKLRVVTLLQEMGEVVAVTGDGVNDAPAIKHADIGISMASGSEITKSAGDVVLLDNCFSTIVKAISFGRNVFDNFQRFITFQLNVNLASIAIILTYLILGLESPFTSTCLLWLNVIMDGPLALSLGLEMRDTDFTERRPVKRNSDILSKKMLLRIAVHSFFMCFVVTLQQLYDFLGVRPEENGTVTISMFVFFQLFNAINCRELRGKSALKGLTDNKLLLSMLCVTYLTHILIVTFAPAFFGSVRISPMLWLKITAVCSSVLVFSEGYKLVYRALIKLPRPKIAKIGIMKRGSIT